MGAHTDCVPVAELADLSPHSAQCFHEQLLPNRVGWSVYYPVGLICQAESGRGRSVFVSFFVVFCVLRRAKENEVVRAVMISGDK